MYEPSLVSQERNDAGETDLVAFAPHADETSNCLEELDVVDGRHVVGLPVVAFEFTFDGCPFDGVIDERQHALERCCAGEHVVVVVADADERAWIDDRNRLLRCAKTAVAGLPSFIIF